MSVIGQLGLFGAEIAVQEGTTQFYALGEYAVIGKIQTLPGNKLTIELKGIVCDVDLTLKTTCAWALQAGRVRLSSTPAPTSSVQAALILDRVVTVTSPRLRISSDPRLELEIEMGYGEMFVWLSKSQLLPPPLSIDTGSAPSVVRIDAAKRSATHIALNPKGVRLWVNDKFTLDPEGTQFGPQQEARIPELKVIDGTFECQARPSSDLLFVHADVLDTSLGDPKTNAFLFQHALVNGQLAIAGKVTGPSASLHWVSTSGQHPPAVLLLRNQDEHGHPLVFEPKTPLPLSYRNGYAYNVSNDTSAEAWNGTNPALVIGSPKEATAFRGSIRSLNDEELYEAFAEPAAAKNGFATPWFVTKAGIPISKSPPIEIHGLARGAWLRRNTDGDPAELGPIEAELVVEPKLEGDRTTMHMTQLRLLHATDWQLKALREERDLRPPDSAGGSSPIGKYHAVGVNSDPLSLPAIDMAFAFSNLVGVERVNAFGRRLGDGRLLAFGASHLDAMERQFSGPAPSHFQLPSVPVQRHAQGAGVLPWDKQPFEAVLDRLPTSARADETGRPGPRLLASSSRRTTLLAAALGSADPSRFVLGGNPNSQLADLSQKLEQRGLDAKALVEKVVDYFEVTWRAAATIADHEVAELRRTVLGIVQRTEAEISEQRAAELLDLAIAYVTAKRNLDDISEAPDALLDELEAMSAEQFLDFLKDPNPEEGFRELLEHVWSPGDYDLLRRIVRLIAPPADPGTLAQKLFGVAEAELSQLLMFLDDPADGILQGVYEGLNETWLQVVELWKTGGDELAALRAKYGPFLTPDVYRRLLEEAAREDAERLLDYINGELGFDLRSLADLSAEPPEYLLRTKRFPVHVEFENLTDALWRQCFDLCAFATDKAWSFFFDDSASLLLKLGQRRGLAEILRELVASYATTDRPDPFGLSDVLPPDAPLGDATGLVNTFIERLDPDLLDPAWMGIFILRPVADIHKDQLLSDLCGFAHITAAYVAIGGRSPDFPGPESHHGRWPPTLDVWAHIFQQKLPGDLLPGDPRKEGHLELVLTKFDVRIRQTRLSDATIEVRILPRDLLGKKDAFPEVLLHGSLEPAGAEPKAPPDLVFAAQFPNRFKIPIKLAFFDELELSSLRVARRNGSTSIDIDADLTLQDPPGLDLRFDLNDALLKLRNFRIQLPSLPGMRVPIGQRRKLDFDFPAVGFDLPKPRTVNIFGVEVTPTGLGYFRGNETGAALELERQYLWLRRLRGITPGSFVSYLKGDLAFGKFPTFGLVEARSLRFRCVVAVRVENGLTVKDAYFGISGLDAKDLKIDLFGVITLEIEHLRISRGKLKERPDGGADTDVGAVVAERVRLKIFNWSPLPEKSRFDVVMLHADARGGNRDQRKGFLAFYDAEAPVDPEAGEEKPEEKFFQVFWVLLAQNLSLPKEVLNYLLERGPGGDDAVEPDGLLKRLLVKPKEGDKPDDPRRELEFKGVDLLDRESWLFGIAFKLGELFTRCNLVLHDQHYYGIHLWAPWVQTLFGQESIMLAYLPGKKRSEDRFRTNLRIPALDMIGNLRSGEIALEWAFNWDFLIDVGFPWRTEIGYDWFRSFSVPVGAYEGKFGFYIEKKTTALQEGDQIILGAGIALYIGLFFGGGNSVAWVRAGIGVFGILQGEITLTRPEADNEISKFLKSSIRRIEVIGVVGIFAYGEGGIDVWILSARFRVSAQASLATSIIYLPGASCTLTYQAELAAGYRASVRVGRSPFSWKFSVSGSVRMPVSGQILIS